MTYAVDEHGLAIDMHLQVIGFTLDKHVVTLQITDQDGCEKIAPTDQIIDASSLKNKKGKGIMDTAFYLVMKPDDLEGVRRLQFDISFDHQIHATSYLFITRGESHA